MSEDREHIVILHKTLAQSLASNLQTIATVISLIGIGVVLDSTAMQWVGALIAFIVIIGRASALKNHHRMTIPEARKLLDDLEARS